MKVGRPALDEDAIRWIEEHNPDIEFDWQKILEAHPPPIQSQDDSRNRRSRRDAASRPKATGRQTAPAPRDEPAAPAEPLPPEPADEGKIVEEALEQLTHPDAEENAEPSELPAEHTLHSEQLIRLRARYAEIQARITERGGEAARIESLRVLAESLNPDSWVTADEVRKGLEDFEPRIRELRAALGLPRRRRSRRGGRRSKGQTDAPGEPQGG